MTNPISNIQLTHFTHSLHIFTNYIIQFNSIPTHQQYLTHSQAKQIDNINHYYNLHLYNILNTSQNPVPDLYKYYLNKIKISNYSTPPSYYFKP